MSVYRKTMSAVVAVTLAMLLAGGGLSQAATVELDALDSGWWRNDGRHYAYNANYIAGKSGSRQYRNFFVFDLSGVTELITSATLTLYNPSNGYLSAQSTEAYSLYDVSTTSISDLTTSGAGKTWIYDDLGAGVSYGSTTVSAADNGDEVEIVLNFDGVTGLNGASGSFAIGGGLTSIGSGYYQRVFGYTHVGNPTRKLILETQDYQTSEPVPEPSTFILMGSGLVLFLGRRFKNF